MTVTRRSLGDYPYTHPLQTRWSDNDVYGHVNNVTYYAYFDTAVNAFLIREGLLDPERGDVIGLVVETGCQYFSSLSFPDALTVGVAVERLGNSSVRYRLGVFRAGQDEPCAQGHFVHVYVDRGTRRPVPLPGPLRAALASLQVEPST